MEYSVLNCFGLLGLISAVLMSGMEVKLIKPPQMSHTCGTSKSCQSAQTSELVIYNYLRREGKIKTLKHYRTVSKGPGGPLSSGA